ncbi:serine hydrolase [Sphingosinicella rhizophila]|uniref:Serine hydrolase n=1 Tax=Sphingosinicella rhizophila TaxID=3050082 RepID=A0ABU3Q8C5_9SPHN|nr:serine hydrolase [Sphingosinicella sp. GR2756]MDT9599185.1 serine hydrolase [Sphingosinicella sp. GR2756]
MKVSIPGGFALLLLGAGGVHAQQASRLQVGAPVPATLAADATLRYALDLPKDHFVAGRVDQDGVDATVTITDPAGKNVVKAARVGRGGPETFAFATDAAGRYLIEVTPATAGKGGALRVQLTRSEPVATTPAGKVDQAAAQLYEDTPGAVVGVINGGKLTFVKGYGAADLTWAMPFTAGTPTNIGSSSKQFTGFAIALLASRGKLSMNDDVRKHIPELKDFGKTITVRNLLTHTTGYREFINTLLIEGRQVLQGDYIAPDEVIKVINRQPTLQNEPGAEFNYNNSAFALATILVERVTGRPFAEWMRDEVFLPLGMTKTWVRAHPGQIIPRRSAGYVAGEGGFREVQDLHGSMGAGGIYTTPGDVAKWMGNLKTGKLGGPAVIKELTTSFVLNDGKPTNYGYGVSLDTNRGLRRWQHGGNDVAHSSTFVYYPDLDAGYVVFSNYQGVPGGIARVAADAFFGQHMTAPETATTGAAVDVPAATLERYVGKYEMTTLGGMLMTVEMEDGQLRLQLPGQPALPLRPTSMIDFEVVGAPARITFNAAADGAVDTITFHQDGEHSGKRVVETAAAVDLTDYTGRYYSEELETFYDMRVEDGQLVIRHRRFGPAVLTHTSGDSFSGTLPVNLVVFRRDAQGKVIGFDAGNGRARDIAFKKVSG